MATLEIRVTDDPAGWLRLHSPYSDQIRAEVKAIPYQERKWDGKAWLVHSSHLDALRDLAHRVAEAEGWTVRDFTAMSGKDIAVAAFASATAGRETHVVAFLAVLPSLPYRSLKLVRWHPGRMVLDDGVYVLKGRETARLQLELTRYLDDALFSDLQAACLDNRRETMIVAGDRAGFGWKFEIADDPRLIRALWERDDVQGMRPIRGLSVVEQHGQGRTVLSDASGVIWLGVEVSRVAVSDWNHHGSDPWPVAVVDGDIYVVFQRETWFTQMLEYPHSVTVWFSGRGHPLPTESQVMAIATEFNQVEWLRGWLGGKMESPFAALKPRFLRGNIYDPASYTHPGDMVLSHFGYLDGKSIRRAQDLAVLMGWTAADLLRFKQQISDICKSTAAMQAAADRSKAGELARERLEKMTKADLLALAEETGLTVTRSARKPDLVTALVGHQPAAEKIIGL